MVHSERVKEEQVIPELSICCRLELTAAGSCFPAANLG